MSSTTTTTRTKPNIRVLRAAVFAVIGFAVAIAILVAVLVVTYALAPLSNDPHSPVVVVVVRRDMVSDKQIGKMLEDKHLIRRAGGFVLAARQAHVSGKMVAGTYELSASMAPKTMAVIIAFGRTAEDFVMIPEGATVRQIADRLGAKHLADTPTFLDLASKRGRTFRIAGVAAPSNNLEGYLFPDTYRIPKGTTERDIVEMMLEDFSKRVLPLNGGLLAKHPNKLPAVITMASMVEREAKVDGDRPKIAAALGNRLHRGMKLQCDATVEYALPHYKTRLFYKDLAIDSPYNTYLHAGLPPTPIASPGLASIKAALHPSAGKYLYYVARPDGTHIFSETVEAHNHAVALLRATRHG